MVKWLFVFLQLLLLEPLINAQQNHIFTAYTVNDGLPQGSIWDITQDKNGFIWASTSDGLCRFDGFKFTVYKHNPSDSNSINYEKDNCFYIDKQKQLWISSERGISLYNYSTNKFTNIYSCKPKKIHLQNSSTFYGEHKGFIWAGLPNIGLIKINIKTHEYILVKNVKGTDLSNYIFWIKGFIEDGNIYGNNESAFFKYNIDANNVQLLDDIEVAMPALSINKNEILTANTTNFFFINKQSLQVKKLPIHLPKAVQIANDISFNQEDSSQIIFATPVGLQYLDIKSGKLIKTISDFDPDKESKYSYAECLFTDKSGNFWIGTNGDGLRKMMKPFKKFKHYKTNNSRSSIVKSIYADFNKLFIGYFNNGIDVFSRKAGFEKNIDVAKLANIPNNNIYNIIPLNKTEYLLHIFGENGAAIFVYSIATNKYTNVTSAFKNFIPKYPSLKNCLFSFLKRNEDSFIASCNNYLLSMQYNNGKLKIKQINSLKNEDISTIFEGHENSLWLGTYNGVYHYKNDKWIPIELKKKVLVKTINQDNDGNIWVGSVEGIYVINKNDKITNLYSEQTGLINHHVYSILKDDGGNMWYSSNKGLGVYLVKEKRFKFFTKEDGLQANEFNTNASFKALDGELFFGGINGTNAFYAKEIIDNPNVPAVQITGIKLFDEPYKTDSSYWSMHSLNLPYTDNSLSFEFVLPEFTNQQKNQYAYMMEGIDKKWIQAGDKRFARYPALAPGNYTFKVKAANNDGVWNEQPTTIDIYIVPPFWQRTWFIVLSVLAAIGLVFSASIYWQKRLHQKALRALEIKHKLQLERERISRDLHDNVGTHMSVLSKSLESIIEPGKDIIDAEKINQLSLLSASSKEVISNLRESIWALHKENVSIEEFADKLKAYTQKQIKLAPSLQLQIKEDILQADTLLHSSQAIHLFRICQEAITNSMKYASANTLTLAIFANKIYYEILIEDDGIGFDLNLKDGDAHYGLQNMKFRAAEINCSFTIESTIGKGTSIRIHGK